MNMNSAAHPLRQYYRNITFDTLKERHDNFSFNKVIRTKQVLNDTIHFQGLLDRPTDPKLVVYKKMGAPTVQDVTERNQATAPQPGAPGSTADSHYYQNDQYLSNAANPQAYQDFQRQFGGPQAANLGMSNYSGFSAGQAQPPRIKSEFSSGRKGVLPQDPRAEHAGNMTS